VHPWCAALVILTVIYAILLPPPMAVRVGRWCSYDLVADDDFILGPVPSADDVFAGLAGAAPDISSPVGGRVLAQLAVQGGTVYDIRRFAPARFAGGDAAGGLQAGGVS